ncbi:aminotransferase class I and II [Aminomonas paucivorans DSM 12260]|uniref:Aminotransferase n=1 Tax=Aminomonas paucivorans DSM 12260 TaxID=584708 RepID=E3CY11_9BACT|nr:aminotransferase class I/II-fold pyridoxal phosphate-dependent enzyme [Aminomonas paucivorans]EFQ24498.1 aminotransferase class I and II [Aminomonas paucivorans DSM 12260]
MRRTWRDRLGAAGDQRPDLYCLHQEPRPYEVDCSLGVNPLGMSPRVAARLREPLSGLDLAPYPRGEGPLAEALSSAWDGLFRPEQVLLGCGSMGVLLSLLRVLARPGASLLGLSPQFPDFPFQARFSGMEARSLPLFFPEYALEPERLLREVAPGDSAVYLDRPHNPTGQVLPLGDVARLAERCGDCGASLLVDEAYGEFLPEAESALNLDHPAVTVVRSFSKGWGLAGLRVGYGVVRDPQLREVLGWSTPPFEVSALGTELACEALKERDFPARSRAAVAFLKREVLKVLGGVPGLRTAATDPEVPLLLGVAEDPGEDLYETFLRRGIRTESGRAYPGLGARAVRLRVPREGDLARFRELWEEPDPSPSPE